MLKAGTDYELEDQIGFVLRLAVQFHTAIFTGRMVEGLTQTQFATLAKLYQAGARSQSELAKLLALDTATVNGVVERMTARGLLVSTDDPHDRRRQTVALSRKGTVAVKAAIASAREITLGTLSNLSPTEGRRLIHLLRKMMGNDDGSTRRRPANSTAAPKEQRPKTAAPAKA